MISYAILLVVLYHFGGLSLIINLAMSKSLVVISLKVDFKLI